MTALHADPPSKQLNPPQGRLKKRGAKHCMLLPRELHCLVSN